MGKGSVQEGPRKETSRSLKKEGGDVPWQMGEGRMAFGIVTSYLMPQRSKMALGSNQPYPKSSEPIQE